MKEIVAELSCMPVQPGWFIQPVFWVHSDKPEEPPRVVVHIFHDDCRTPGGPAQYCGLTNREEVMSGALPTYECNKCAEDVPKEVVEEKLLAQGKYRWYDPRNNRRAAVLAQKNKGTQNVRN